MSFFGNLSTLFGAENEDSGQSTSSNRSGSKQPSKSSRSSKSSKSKQQDNTQRSSRQSNKGRNRRRSKSNKSRRKSSDSSSNNKKDDARRSRSQQKNKRSRSKKRSSRKNQQTDVEAAAREAQAKAREIIVEAKDEALAIKANAEQEARKKERQLEEQQRNIDRKLDKIDFRLSQLEDKESSLDKKRTELDKLNSDLTKKRDQIIDKLESVSNLTSEEAKKELFERLERKLAQEMATYIRQQKEEAKSQADEAVQEILVDSMKHGATDYVPEYTVSTVELPSEEIKGKIIGKSGRNIHTFEKVTGVDLDLDSSPTEVRLSCFDSVRREIARIALERLIKDGRIQPSRIEEVVAKVETELEKIMFEAGKKLCHDVGVYNLPNDLMKMLGRFKYRFSYGQNLIAHTLEETKIGIKLAHELGANVNVVKLGCLLHDIGKVSNDEEGSHVELGVKIAKKYSLPQPVIDAIAQHHEDEPFSGPEQMIVYIADAISGARPGARYENYDEYIERLQKLEDIATKHDPVKTAYAIQAGREIRVLLEPEKSKDADVEVLALKIKDEIEETMTYPGTVTVTVMRETRTQAVAK